jgi:gamma-glutamyltranspeptidase/glutathione hydrolase
MLDRHRDTRMTRRLLLLLISCWLPPLAAADTATPAPAPAALAPAAPAAPEGGTGRYALSAASAEKAMAVTANPHATDAALEMLRTGGSAIDAAIAAQAVLGLVEPQSSGFGGGAFLVYHDGQKTLSVDGRETAPASAREDRFLEADGQPLPFHAAILRGKAVGVPGVLAALEAAHQRYGKLPWRRLFEPAIHLSRNGFAISPRLAALIARDPLLAQQPSTRAYFFNAEGRPLPAGHLLKNPEYAKTLERIADNGARAFYKGRFARRMIAELNRAGADFTTADWARYEARVSNALCKPYRVWAVCSAPPPSGGWTVLQTLALLDEYPYVGNRPLFLHRLLEAERLAFADRQRYSADPAFVPVPLAGLFDSGYLDSRRALIGPKSMQRAKAGVPPGLTAPWGSDGQLLENGTTQLTVVDSSGHWLSMTSSIEDAFGSRLLVEGLLFNNQLTDFSFAPRADGHPVANRVQGGKRPRSAMAPVIVLDADRRGVLALGSPGGSRIIGYVLLALVASLDEELPPAEVVSQPLLLSRNGPTEVDADFPPALRAALGAFGQPITEGDLNSGLAIIRRDAGGRLQGAADPRREGRAAGF